MDTIFMSRLPIASESGLVRNPSQDMLLARHHVFSTYNKYGKEKAEERLLYRHSKDELSDNQGIGLDAELQFYDAFKRKLNLVPTLDCGDHVDFVSGWNGELYRIDVTTNLFSKKIENYINAENHVVAVWNGKCKPCKFFCVRNNHFEIDETLMKGAYE